MVNFSNSYKIRYKFHETEEEKLKDFYLSYPVFSFVAGDGKYIKWLPSEYFYRQSNEVYWLAIDPYGGGNGKI